MADDTQKDPVAQAMVAKRWAKTTAKQRSQIAKDAANARWAGHVPKASKTSKPTKAKRVKK